MTHSSHMIRLPVFATLALSLMISSAWSQDSFGGQPKPQPRQAEQTQPPVMQQQGQQQQQQPQQQNFGSPQPEQPANQNSQFAQAEQFESQDFGVAPVSQLYSGTMHGPTPTTIPGGLVISTEALWTTLQQNQGGIAIFDVLGGQEILPGAYAASPAAAPGSFNDQTQQEFGQFLTQVTGGNKQVPLLFYCQSPQCWMSYNASLRAINMGYTQVLWYRGGIEAWKKAGLPTEYPQMSYQ